MKFTSRIFRELLKKELLQATVYRVDMDRVDVAPLGSSGILRSLPLTGDRDKIKPGDPVRIVTIGSERVALAPDVALDFQEEEVSQTVEGAVQIPGLEEALMGIGGASSTDAQTLQGLLPAESGADAHVVISSADGTITPDNITTPYLTVSVAAAFQAATIQNAEVVGNLNTDSDLNVAGKITAGANTNLAGPTCGFTYMVDGGGSVVGTGDKGFVEIPVAMHISSIDTLNNASSTVTCTIYKCTYATYGTWTQIASGIGTTTALKNSQPINLDFAAGDIIYVNVTACSAANKFSLNFKGYRN